MKNSTCDKSIAKSCQPQKRKPSDSIRRNEHKIKEQLKSIMQPRINYSPFSTLCRRSKTVVVKLPLMFFRQSSELS